MNGDDYSKLKKKLRKELVFLINLLEKLNDKNNLKKKILKMWKI